MKKSTKLRFKRGVAVASLTFSLLLTSVNIENVSAIGHLGFDSHSVEYQDYEFSNKELEKFLKRKFKTEHLTAFHLDNVYFLDIVTHVMGENLSDLKYMPNLNHIMITEGVIDLSCLKDNTKLTQVSLSHATVTNSSSLPNSITQLNLYDVTLEDKVLVCPGELSQLSISRSSLGNIYFKNLRSLRNLRIDGDFVFNLEDIKDSELEYLTLERICNVRNGNVLKDMSVSTIKLDDYSLIWLDTDTLESIPYTSKNDLVAESQEIDKIVKLLDHGTEQDKIDNIISFILGQMEFDTLALGNGEGSKFLFEAYNKLPIYYALRGEGVSICYASLFQTLANRLGVNSTVYLADRDAWNKVNDTYYDLGYKDQEDSLSYFHDEKLKDTTYVEPVNYDLKIEKYEEVPKFSVKFKGQIFLISFPCYLALLSIIGLISGRKIKDALEEEAFEELRRIKEEEALEELERIKEEKALEELRRLRKIKEIADKKKQFTK